MPVNNVLQLAEQRVADRARCKTDKLFLAEILGYDFIWTTHAELFACYITYDPDKTWVDQDPIKDRLILWSRGHYKTTSVVVEIIQAILNNPNIRILIMQGSIKVTKNLLKEIKSHFLGEAEHSRLKELFPEFCANKLKELGPNPTMQFIVPARTRKQLREATVSVASPRSVKTGQHYEMGFFDDLVNDQNYRNPKLLDKVREDFTLAQALVDPGGYRFVTGTRYAFGDLYEEILRWQAKSGKWIISIRNCWSDDTQNVPDDEKIPRFAQFKKHNGEMGGFTTEYLLQLQTDDPAVFACQYLNQPIHSTQQAYSEPMLRNAVVIPDQVSALSFPIMMIDLATSDALKADDSVIQVGQVDSLGIGYVTDQRGGQWAPMEMSMQVIDMTLRHRPVKVFIEKSAAGQVFFEFVRLVAKTKNVYLPLEFVKIDNRPDAKNMRVLGLAGAIKKGRFKFFSGLPNFDRLIQQAVEFPKGRNGHDDYIDTAALLYGELSKELMSMPARRPHTDPILAMMADRENALMRILTADELQQVEQPDVTGLD